MNRPLPCPGATALRRDPAVRTVLRDARRAAERRQRAAADAEWERLRARQTALMDIYSQGLQGFVKHTDDGKVVPL